jgi:hypothetical protein
MSMNAAEFRQVKREIMARIRRGDRLHLTGMEDDIFMGVELSDRLSLIDFKRTGEADQMIRARCRPMSIDITGEALAADLERVWMEVLRYREGFEAHRLTASKERIMLDGITGPAESTFYITVRIEVDFLPRQPWHDRLRQSHGAEPAP